MKAGGFHVSSTVTLPVSIQVPGKYSGGHLCTGNSSDREVTEAVIGQALEKEYGIVLCTDGSSIFVYSFITSASRIWISLVIGYEFLSSKTRVNAI